jgi:tRNA pseudouridine38-40 synthase
VTWKLTLEYDGTRYSGWQEQKNARTVGGEVKRAAEAVLKTEVELGGAGRTDAGVHAAAQVAHLRARIVKGPKPVDLKRAINDELPADIAILEVDEAPHRFHARHDATSRAYVYQIATRKMAFSKKYVWWVRQRLDVEKMTAAAAMLAGRHDFVCFRAADPSRPDESTIVVVESAAIERDGDLLVFRIEASHFLWRMVRRVVGALVELGKGSITPADFERLLAGKASDKLDVAAWTAPASGLFLDGVTYPVEPLPVVASKAKARRSS